MKIFHSSVLVSLLAAMTQLSGADHAQSPERPRAFQQQDQADLVLLFRDWDELLIKDPEQSSPSTWLTQSTFLSILETQKTRRNLVVIILDKRVPRPGKDFSNEKLVSAFHKLGFRRVVIQQAQSAIHPDGLPILTDSTVPEANQP